VVFLVAREKSARYRAARTPQVVPIGTLRRIAWTFALVSWCILAGCAPREVIKLHYLPGFVPGTRAVFLPANLAVAPVSGDLASGTPEVGGIYDSSGRLAKLLQVSDAGAVVNHALMNSLADAGLKPIALESGMDSKNLKMGVDLMLTCELRQITFEQNFGVQQTIHGQYFTMASRVKLKYQLQRRNGSIVYANEVTGMEDEPPKPVGGEVFFPLETDPAESLSVALSRAIGNLLTDPKFREAFPLRSP
jgi:hypothetical protein